MIIKLGGAAGSAHALIQPKTTQHNTTHNNTAPKQRTPRNALDAARAAEADDVGALAEVVQGQRLAADRLRLLDARPQRLHHLKVSKVVHDVLEHVAVRLGLVLGLGLFCVWFVFGCVGVRWRGWFLAGVCVLCCVWRGVDECL